MKKGLIERGCIFALYDQDTGELLWLGQTTDTPHNRARGIRIRFKLEKLPRHETLWVGPLEALDEQEAIFRKIHGKGSLRKMKAGVNNARKHHVETRNSEILARRAEG